MPKVTYVATDGTSTQIDVDPGSSVMEAAVSNGVDGIIGECGGSLSCSTCHVYVDEKNWESVNDVDGLEDDMLEGTSSPRRETSRLSCQITATDEIDGLVVHLPESQA